MSKLILLRTFPNPVEAHILKAKLEGEGIQVFLHDENMIAMYSVATHGVKVMINDFDADRALKVMKMMKEDEESHYEDYTVCPYCQHKNPNPPYDEKPSFLTMLLMIFAIATPVKEIKKYKCPNCGRKYKQESTDY